MAAKLDAAAARALLGPWLDAVPAPAKPRPIGPRVRKAAAKPRRR